MLLAQRQARKPVIVWAVAALAAYVAYYFHYTHSGPPVPISAFLHEPINAVCYFFVMFGRAFTYDLYPAMCIGAIAILTLIPALLLVWERRDRITIYLPWLALILFSLIGAAMIILGRLVPDPNINTPLTDAMQSRYTAMSIMYIVGLSGLIISLADSMRLNSRLFKYFVMVILVVQVPLLFLSYYAGFVNSKERHTLMIRLQRCSQQPVEKISKDCLSSNNYLNTNPTAKEQLQYLKSKHWAGY
jgi:hypothetical protein